jgi:hypothetical protein
MSQLILIKTRYKDVKANILKETANREKKKKKKKKKCKDVTATTSSKETNPHIFYMVNCQYCNCMTVTLKFNYSLLRGSLFHLIKRKICHTNKSKKN